MPFRSGLPSAVRGARYAAGVWPESGVDHAVSHAPPAAATKAMRTPPNVFRTETDLPAGDHTRRILMDCQYFQLTPSGPTLSIRPPPIRPAARRDPMRPAPWSAAMAIVSCVVFFIPANARAQQRASIVGVVQDSTGAVL